MKYNILLIWYFILAYFNTTQNYERGKRCVLTTDSNAAPFTSKILKKINTHCNQSCVVYRVQVYTGRCVKLAKAAGGLHFRKLARSLRAVSVLPRRASARAKCIRCSQFAAMATIPYKQNAPCAHDMPRFSLSHRCPPAARLVATEGTVAGVKKCHRTGRDTTVNSERVFGGDGGGPRVLCEINRPASPCTRTTAGSVERGHRWARDRRRWLTVD